MNKNEINRSVKECRAAIDEYEKTAQKIAEQLEAQYAKTVGQNEKI